jgi:hypothetical protein
MEFSKDSLLVGYADELPEISTKIDAVAEERPFWAAA